MANRAVFLDRDNTIIADPGYIDDPDLVSLLSGVADSIRKLNEAGFLVVVVTNQSGVARGLITEDQLGEIHERLREILLEQGARLDAIYYCPYLDGPEAAIERYRRASDERKPGAGMFFRAAEELDIDLPGSWMIGNSARDVIAGRRAGCRTIWIDQADESEADNGEPDAAAASLPEAVDLLLANPDLPRRVPPAPSREAKPETADIAAAEALHAERLAVLHEVRDTLKRIERADRYDDFSVARLAGTLTQMLALVAAGWGLAALFGGSEAALARLVLALFLQMLALTAFLASRRK